MLGPPVTSKPDGKKALLRNRKARHDYAVDETLETGIVLAGSEVKSLRAGNGSLVDAYADIRGGELYLVGAKVDPYPFANNFNHEPIRDRKLLAHRQEIKRLATKVREKGYTLIPLEVYLLKGKIKVEIGLARGKKQYEKRDASRAREAEREMDEGK
jgi:SsrA-binding protein